MRNILYCGYGWADNIGNAFIDLGIDYSLNQVKKDDDVIIKLSNINNLAKGNYGKRFPFSWYKNDQFLDFDLRTLINANYIVLGGSLFTYKWFKYQPAFINYLISEQVPVIVLGGGGGNVYSQSDQDIISDILKKINLHALITRDSRTYESYNKFAKKSYDGIDSAFFLNNAFKPATLNLKNIYLSIFDLIGYEPKIDIPKGVNVIKLYHRYVDVGSIFYLRAHFREFFKIISKKHVISDCPDDYLHLMGNAKHTYSDRVHACIATLIFGGKAMYFDNSDRSYLFDRIGIYDKIKSGPTHLDMTMIEMEKKKQLNFLDSVLNES